MERTQMKPLFCLMERINEDYTTAEDIRQTGDISFAEPDEALPRFTGNIGAKG